MPSTAHVLGYALTSLVLIAVPGPGVLFVVGRALSYGRRTALETVFGHVGGNYVLAVCVAFGVGALVQRSLAVFTVIKLAGALYLAWLGISAIRHRTSLADSLTAPGQSRPRGSALRQGFAVGVTNPKALILFGAVLPQFVDRGAGDVTIQMLLLALISVAIGVVCDSLWAVSASVVRTWFARSPRRFAAVGGAGGVAMIAVAVTVALAGRSD